MIYLSKGKDSFYCRHIKRILDIVCSLAAMIVFCWLYVIIAVLVKFNLGSPVIFKQQRPGKGERLFYIYKFRTMTEKKDESGVLLPNEERLTKFGKILRSTSLDELPEAWNILKGDISVIGPRPLRVEYLDRYNEMQHHRHDVKPGLSGYSQVNGRNCTTWEQRFKEDLWYIDNLTFALDVKIVVKTIKILIKREGINSSDGSMMHEFMGNSYYN